MRSGDLIVSPCGAKAILHLPCTKTSKRNRQEESVSVTDRKLIGFAQALQCQRLPGDKILAVSMDLFRRRFRQLLVDLELQGLYILPYSWQRSKTTAHFRSFNSLHKTAIRERWNSLATARIYINEALSELGQYTTDSSCKVNQASVKLDCLFGS